MIQSAHVLGAWPHFNIAPQLALKDAKKNCMKYLRSRECVGMTLGPLCRLSDTHPILTHLILAFPIPNAQKQKQQFGILLCIQYPGLPYFISKSDMDHKSIHLYCSFAHQSCGQNTGDSLVRTASLAECQTREEFTAATTFVIATRLATALLKGLILTPKLDKSLQPSQNNN
jgi:hypothetical protein